MAKICPETGEKVLYPVCLECEDKVCRDKRKKFSVEDYYGNLRRFADPVEMGWKVMEEMDCLDHYFGASGKEDYTFYAELCLERGYKGIIDIGCAYGFQSECFTEKGLKYYGIDNACRKFWDAGNPLVTYRAAAYPCTIPEEAKAGMLPVSRLCLGYFLDYPECMARDFNEILIDGGTGNFFEKADGLYEKKERLYKEGMGCVLYSGSRILK